MNLMGPPMYDPELLAAASGGTGVADPAVTPPTGLPPQAPETIVPNLLTAPAPNFATSAGLALGNVPKFEPAPFESRGSSLLRGLLSGAAHGYSTGAQQDYEAQKEATANQNKMNVAAAERNNALAQESWKARLADFYKTKEDASGRMTVTPQMAKELPELAPFVGQGVDTKALVDAHMKAVADRNAAEKAQATEVETQRHNRAMEDIERNKAMTEAKKVQGADPASWLQYAVRQTSTGLKYLDGTNVGPKDKKDAMAYAGSIGLPFVTANQRTKLDNLDDARANIRDMLSQASSFLYKGKSPVGRVLNAAGNLVAGAPIVGNNPIIKSWGTFRVAAIQQLVALAGGQGSGLRVNQAEIRAAVENDIPRTIDDWSTAERRATNILAMLDNAERAIAGGNDASGLTTKIGSDGLRHIVVGNYSGNASGTNGSTPSDPYAKYRK